MVPRMWLADGGGGGGCGMALGCSTALAVRSPQSCMSVAKFATPGAMYELTCPKTPLPTRSLTHPITHSLTHPLTHSPSHSLTDLSGRSLTHTLTHSLTRSLTDPLVQPIAYSPTYAITNSRTLYEAVRGAKWTCSSGCCSGRQSVACSARSLHLHPFAPLSLSLSLSLGRLHNLQDQRASALPPQRPCLHPL